jgi:Domain of unknown function (DUF4388)
MSDSALEGDLRHFLPSEVFQLLHLAQATGRLEFARATETAELFFERGRPVFARTSGSSVKVGQILVHRGEVSPEALELALAVQKDAPGERVGSMLVGSGAATPEQIQRAVAEVVRRILYGMLLWRDGRFGFYPGERAVGEDVHLDVELDRLILEGLRIADTTRRER